MNYLIAYITIGVIFLLVMVGYQQYEKQKTKNGSELAELVRAIEAKEKRSWWSYVIEWTVFPLVVSVITIIAWPVFVILMVKEKWWAGKEAAPELDEEFVVTLDHIQQRMTREEIESKERVSDPLGAAPDLPFGHLNAAWVQFRGSLQPDDELWFFSAPWTEWSHTEQHEGYVVLRKDDIGPWFTAVIRQVDSMD